MDEPSAHFVAFLTVTAWQEGEIVLMLDNLSPHKTLDGFVWGLAPPRVRF